MENTIKVQIIDTLAQYNALGTKVIDTAYDIYSNNGGVLTFDEFYSKLDIREMDSIDYMYDSDREVWASDEDMIKEFNNLFGI